jgi:hypothetical protein
MAASVQTHIHIDTDDPPTTEYKITRYSPQYKVFITLNRALDGTLRRGALASGGNPIVFTDRVYQAKVTQAELATLSTLLGRTINLVDSLHDAADHASYSKAMVFRSISNVTNEGVAAKATLDTFLCTIEFEDANTV